MHCADRRDTCASWVGVVVQDEIHVDLWRGFGVDAHQKLTQVRRAVRCDGARVDYLPVTTFGAPNK